MTNESTFRFYIAKGVNELIDNIKRGEIYLADLRPTVGSEQGGKRPVLVLQNDIGNYYSPTTIVASITSNTSHKHILPTHVQIEARDELNNDSLILLEQIRTIDKKRLIRRLGNLKKDEIKKVNVCSGISIGI